MTEYIFITEPDLNDGWTGQMLYSQIHSVFENKGVSLSYDINDMTGKVLLYASALLGNKKGYIESKKINYHKFREDSGRGAIFTDLDTLAYLEELRTFSISNFKKISNVKGKYPERLTIPNSEVHLGTTVFDNFSEMKRVVDSLQEVANMEHSLKKRLVKLSENKILFNFYSLIEVLIDNPTLKIKGFAIGQSEIETIDKAIKSISRTRLFPMAARRLNSLEEWIIYIANKRNIKRETEKWVSKYKALNFKAKSSTTMLKIDTSSMSLSEKFNYLKASSFFEPMHNHMKESVSYESGEVNDFIYNYRKHLKYVKEMKRRKEEVKKCKKEHDIDLNLLVKEL